MWRQGDVLIAVHQEVPANAKLREGGLLVEGEITGHSHRVEVPSTAEVRELDGQLYIKVVAKIARIVHEEHKPIELPFGLYRIWRQREYTPGRVRSVQD